MLGVQGIVNLYPVPQQHSLTAIFDFQTAS